MGFLDEDTELILFSFNFLTLLEAGDRIKDPGVGLWFDLMILPLIFHLLLK